MLGGRGTGIKRESDARPGPVLGAVRGFGYAGQVPGALVLGDLEALGKGAMIIVVAASMYFVA